MSPVVTRFEEVERALGLFVRALLPDQTFPGLSLAPAGSRRAFANEHGLFFPESYPMLAGEAGRSVYFAAAAHLAAHLRFGAARFRRGSLRAVQVVLVSLFEDARVERLLSAELPGVAGHFRAFHSALPAEHVTFPSLCARISRALSDPAYQDDHALVDKARAFFFEPGAVLSAEHSRRFGSLLGNDVGQTRLSFSEREYLVEPVYRDDHRLLWEEPVEQEQPTHEHGQQQERAKAKPPSDAGRSRGAVPPETLPSLYPEYDYLIERSRPDFCTVRDRRVHALTTPAAAENIEHPTRRSPELLRLANTLRLETRRRRRRQREGDTIDLDAALEARLDLQARQTPDERVYVNMARKRQPLALLLLLDLSASTASLLPNSDLSLLELSRRSALVLGDLLAHVGDSLAIHGFSSNGRHEVEYHRFKEFAEPWDAHTQARLAQLEPRLSTRMGAALRHASRALGETYAERRLLLLLTDGEPADVDAPDPLYLLHDAHQAVAEGRRRALRVLAVSLDPEGAPYLRRIFGAGSYSVLPKLEQLPRVLSELYARLHT